MHTILKLASTSTLQISCLRSLWTWTSFLCTSSGNFLRSFDCLLCIILFVFVLFLFFVPHVGLSLTFDFDFDFVVVCVCVSVCSRSSCFSVRWNQQTTILTGYLRDNNVWSFEKIFREKANELELTTSRFRALSGPTKGGNDLKDDCLVKCCARD